MYRARALSVCEGNGLVRLVASQATSWDGTASRGKRAACVSGPVKSRQIRQTPGVGPEVVGAWTGPAEDLVASNLGLEARGIGGGELGVFTGSGFD